jgi:hypothetical protein
MARDQDRPVARSVIARSVRKRVSRRQRSSSSRADEAGRRARKSTHLEEGFLSEVRFVRVRIMRFGLRQRA